MWVQVVMQQDLGGPIAESKLEAVNAASMEACDKQLTGKHDGYINDIAACSYDPMKDKSVLCAADGGTGGPAICLTMAEARAVNKIWYGPRTDNQMIDPAVDNGWNT